MTLSPNFAASDDARNIREKNAKIAVLKAEKIVAAALFADDIVCSMPRPARHHHIIAMMNKYGFSKGRVLSASQGFLTSEGRFVTRDDAFAIAKSADQIISGVISSDTLFSEDVW